MNASVAGAWPVPPGRLAGAGQRCRGCWWLAVMAAVALVGCRPERGEVVAPGVYHHRLQVADGPWLIHLLEIDLPQAWRAGVRLRPAVPPDGGVARTSVLAAGALAAINGDYFYTQETIRIAGLQLRDGCLLQSPQGRSAFAVTADGQPSIGVFHLEAGLFTPAGRFLPIVALNRRPPAAGLSLYDPCADLSVDSVRAEVGYELESLGQAAAINDTVPVAVTQVRRQAWPLHLGPGQWLVAAGRAWPDADRIAAGDTLGLCVGLRPAGESLPGSGHYTQGIGGGPRLLRDGVISVEYAAERLNRGFAEERHPRTALGYSRDRRWLFLITVDGRQPGYSVGMTLTELAQFMQTGMGPWTRSGATAYQAMNLDGGGSTTMVIRQQVVNRPSDQTGERPVANALLVTASPESGRER